MERNNTRECSRVLQMDIRKKEEGFKNLTDQELIDSINMFKEYMVKFRIVELNLTRHQSRDTDYSD